MNFNLYILIGATANAYKNSCPKFEARWFTDAPYDPKSIYKDFLYEYNIPKGAFCSDFCGKTKLKPHMDDPIWFECSKKIMPRIFYYFDDEDHCLVHSDKGRSDPENRKCIQRVAQFFADNRSPDAKLVYLVHGFSGKEFEKSKNFKNIQKFLIEREGKGAVVVGVVNWVTGSRVLASKMFSKSAHRSSLHSRSPTDDEEDTKMKTAYCCTNRYKLPGVKTQCIVKYPTAAANTWPVGNIVAYVNFDIGKTLSAINLKDQVCNANPHKCNNLAVSCIGHSLGAHLCGFFSKRAKELNQKSKVAGALEIQKIIGLDPAGPIFQDKLQPDNLKLTKEDALDVEIMHTNAKTYGFKKSFGHVDIFVNGGFNQPWCTAGVAPDLASQCSHKFAYIFMSWLVKPVSKCKADWKCGKEYFSKISKDEWRENMLASIHTQDTKKLLESGCILVLERKPTPNGKPIEIGTLARSDISQHGIYWIHVGENSETCKVDPTRI